MENDKNSQISKEGQRTDRAEPSQIVEFSSKQGDGSFFHTQTSVPATNDKDPVVHRADEATNGSRFLNDQLPPDDMHQSKVAYEQSKTRPEAVLNKQPNMLEESSFRAETETVPHQTVGIILEQTNDQIPLNNDMVVFAGATTMTRNNMNVGAGTVSAAAENEGAGVGTSTFAGAIADSGLGDGVGTGTNTHSGSDICLDAVAESSASSGAGLGLGSGSDPSEASCEGTVDAEDTVKENGAATKQQQEILSLTNTAVRQDRSIVGASACAITGNVYSTGYGDDASSISIVGTGTLRTDGITDVTGSESACGTTGVRGVPSFPGVSRFTDAVDSVGGAGAAGAATDIATGAVQSGATSASAVFGAGDDGAKDAVGTLCSVGAADDPGITGDGIDANAASFAVHGITNSADYNAGPSAGVSNVAGAADVTTLTNVTNAVNVAYAVHVADLTENATAGSRVVVPAVTAKIAGDTKVAASVPCASAGDSATRSCARAQPCNNAVGVDIAVGGDDSGDIGVIGNYACDVAVDATDAAVDAAAIAVAAAIVDVAGTGAGAGVEADGATVGIDIGSVGADIGASSTGDTVTTVGIAGIGGSGSGAAIPGCSVSTSGAAGTVADSDIPAAAVGAVGAAVAPLGHVAPLAPLGHAVPVAPMTSVVGPAGAASADTSAGCGGGSAAANSSNSAGEGPSDGPGDSAGVAVSVATSATAAATGVIARAGVNATSGTGCVSGGVACDVTIATSAVAIVAAAATADVDSASVDIDVGVGASVNAAPYQVAEIHEETKESDRLTEEGAIWEPAGLDVLSGRGASVNAHKGNKKFRAMCFARKPEFEAGNHAAKRRIATEIVNATLTTSGRFLKKSQENGLWFIMTTDQAILKACQVMRDYKRPDRIALREVMSQNGNARKRQRIEESTPMDDTPLPSAPLEPIIENPFGVHDHDVLSGRGAFVNGHVGNQRLRTLALERKIQFDAGTYTEKRALATEVVNHIRSLTPPGRFLRRVDPSRPSKTEDNNWILPPRGLDGAWEELHDEKAIHKACQVMRDIDRPDRKERDARRKEKKQNKINNEQSSNSMAFPSAPHTANQNAEMHEEAENPQVGIDGVDAVAATMLEPTKVVKTEEADAKDSIVVLDQTSAEATASAVEEAVAEALDKALESSSAIGAGSHKVDNAEEQRAVIV